ncbi:MAG: glycosyltransferase family 2 protein [bacterium]
MRISLVIPNWNGLPVLRECFPTIYGEVKTRHREDEIIVADDASSDGSVPFLKENFPEVKIVRGKGNLGFGKICNLGIREARNEIVILLNNDIKTGGDFITPCLKYFERDDTFAVAFQSLAEDGKTFREGAKKIEFKMGLPFVKHALKDEPKRNSDGTIYSLYAVGGHCAVSKSKFLELGGFDAIYHPFYWEDADLCYRAWKRGWKIYYEPKCVVVHKPMGTIKKSFTGTFIKNIKSRNRILFTWCNFTKQTLLIYHIPFVFWRFLTEIFLFRVDFYAGLFRAVEELSAVKERRKREKNFAKLSDAEILKLFI